jgi:hypothetical protein
MNSKFAKTNYANSEATELVSSQMKYGISILNQHTQLVWLGII